MNEQEELEKLRKICSLIDWPEGQGREFMDLVNELYPGTYISKEWEEAHSAWLKVYLKEGREAAKPLWEIRNKTPK